MVFGNMGDNSGTGVAFTRNPNTGDNRLFGEYLADAQGEDVVGGIRTPLPIAELADANPEVYKQFEDLAHRLERPSTCRTLEFTIERGKLWMLQTRSGKRTARAAVKIAVDLVDEGILTKEDAVERISPYDVDVLLHLSFDPRCQGSGPRGRPP